MEPSLVLELVVLLLKPSVLAGAIVSLYLWGRSGFWVPGYIHRLAHVSGALGLVFAAWLRSIDAPGRLWLLPATFAALVYFYFGIYGHDEIKRSLEEKCCREKRGIK